MLLRAVFFEMNYLYVSLNQDIIIIRLPMVGDVPMRAL